MRMTSLLKLVIAALVLATFVPAVSAQGTGGGIDAKIAFVNSLDVLQGCAEGKAEIAKVDVFASNKEKEIQTASQELNTLRTNYQSEAATLNPATAASTRKINGVPGLAGPDLVKSPWDTARQLPESNTLARLFSAC